MTDAAGKRVLRRGLLTPSPLRHSAAVMSRPADEDQLQSGSSGHGRFIWVTDEDVAVARRVLSVLGSSGPSSDTGRNVPDDAGSVPQLDRDTILQRAQVAFEVHLRRLDVLGPRYSSASPYAILLSLFVHEEREPPMIITRLVTLSRVGLPSTLRWITALLEDGYIERRGSDQDRRLGYILLTQKGRDAVERIFGWTGEGRPAPAQRAPRTKSSI